MLIVEANAETIQQVIDGTGLEPNAEEKIDERFLKSDDITVIEGIVGHDSGLLVALLRILNCAAATVSMCLVARKAKNSVRL